MKGEPRRMKTMATIHRIRNEYFAEGKTISEIAREQNIDRKTIRKYINKDDWSVDLPVTREPQSTLFDTYGPIITRWLEEDKTRRRKQRHTAKRVFDRLTKEYGYTGSYRTIANYVSLVKMGIYHESDPSLPLSHIGGEAQVDFGSADYYERGQKVSGAYLILSFPRSNAGLGQLLPGENIECLFEALLAIFIYLGGVPTTLWFDNASAIVKKILEDGKRLVTDRFAQFQEHFGFNSNFCNPGKGREKGHVEAKVGYVRRNMFVPEPHISSLETYNEQLLHTCEADWHREHYKFEGIIEDLYHTHDQPKLMIYPSIDFDPAGYKLMRADNCGMITIKGIHRYSTSPRFAGELVQLKFTAQHVQVLDDSHRVIVTHTRLYGKKKGEQMNWLPYLQLLSRRPGALKYTPVYSLMPSPLQQWLSIQPKKLIGNALSAVASLTEHTGFDQACNTVTEALERGITDFDSLVALNDRLVHPIIAMGQVAGAWKTQTPTLTFDPQSYDTFLSGGHHE